MASYMTNRFLKVSGFLSLLWLPIMATSAEYKVHMAGWEFKPSPLTISVGDTVVWVNNDDTKHKLSFEDKSLGGPTRDNAHVFKIGDNFSFIFKKTGEYKYTCVTHEGQDMSGVVIVK